VEAAERRGAGTEGNTGEERERRTKLTVFKSCAFTGWQIGLLTRSWLASGLLTMFFVVPAFDVRYVWLTPR
jgi:hypothetical protein